MKKACSILLILMLLLTGCAGETDPVPSGDGATAAPAVDFSQTDQQMFTDRDQNPQYTGGSVICFDADAVSCEDAGVKIDGSTVTITRAGTYILTGSWSNGSVVVDAGENDKVQIVLNGVKLHSESTAPLMIRQADKVFLTLAERSENTLSCGETFPETEDNIDAVIFSKEDLTVNGSGKLTVSSPAGHGIVCKDDLVITGGGLTVQAAAHGIDANDSVRIKSGALVIQAGKDGIHCENADDAELGFVYISGGKLEVDAQGDGISAGAWLQIREGIFNLRCGGGSENGNKEHGDNWGGFPGQPPGMGGRPRSDTASSADTESTSMKGVKSGNSLMISGGSFSIDTADDAIHTNVSATICGGSFEIASGDDAIHAEEELLITGGTILVSESYEALEALHIKVQGGDLTLTATDDGINAAGGVDSSGTGGRDEMFVGGGRPGMGGGRPGMSGNSDGSIVISGGTLYVKASGDGIDANGTLEITGGYTVVTGPTRGDTATLDYDVSGVIGGGIFIGTGASGMAQTLSSETQGILSLSVGNASAGTKITLTDGDGKQILTFSPELDYAVLILSSPEMVKGKSYTVTVGQQSGTFPAE